MQAITEDVHYFAGIGKFVILVLPSVRTDVCVGFIPAVLLPPHWRLVRVVLVLRLFGVQRNSSYCTSIDQWVELATWAQQNANNILGFAERANALLLTLPHHQHRHCHRVCHAHGQSVTWHHPHPPGYQPTSPGRTLSTCEPLAWVTAVPAGDSS